MLTRSLNAVAGLVLAAAGACVDQEPYSPSANTFVVHAVLDASSRDQYVVLQSTRGSLPTQRTVSGASVVITAPDGRALTAEEVQDTARFGVTGGAPPATTVYRISLDRYGTALVAGGRYLLRITMLDGRIVTGATTIPRATPNTAVPDTLRIDRVRDTVRLAWAHVPGAKAYDVLISAPRVQSGFFADTSIALPGGAQDPNGALFFRDMTHSLVVSAVDDNYYDYFRRTSDPFTGAGLITTLNGAVGVFGSMVPIVRRTIVVY